MMTVARSITEAPTLSQGVSPRRGNPVAGGGNSRYGRAQSISGGTRPQAGRQRGMAMGGISDEAIKERAYHIWIREGRPHGRDFEHWVQAQVELEAELRGANGGKPKKKAAAPRKTAAKAAKAAATKADTAKPAAAKPARKPA